MLFNAYSLYSENSEMHALRMHHFGILGHSSEGAAMCFRTFCATGLEDSGTYIHPDVTLDCIAFGHVMTAWETSDYDAIRQTLAVSVGRLAAAGADFFACPDNTAHMALERPGEPLALPGLHLPEVVADCADRNGYTRVGILGTRFTMAGPLYPDALGARGITAVVPNIVDQGTVDTLIFSELVHGKFTDAARTTFQQVIDRLRKVGCDAVALVCTEIPLLITPDISPLPVLDSTGLLAHAAYAVSVGHAPLPTWRGGAVRRPGE